MILWYKYLLSIIELSRRYGPTNAAQETWTSAFETTKCCECSKAIGLYSLEKDAFQTNTGYVPVPKGPLPVTQPIMINALCSLADFDDSDGPVDPNSGDDYISTSSCSGISNSDLGDGCSISDDCSTITCNMDFVKKPITFKLKVFIWTDDATTLIS